MSTVTHCTTAEFLAMPDESDFELIDGQLLERKMGAESSWVGAQLILLLGEFNRSHRQGWVFSSDCGYRCFANPNTVRKPDVSFVRFGRLPGETVPSGWIELAPDLAAEVLSPHDLEYETDQKIEDYLSAGVRLVWIISPESRTVLVYRANGSIVGLREPDELSGEDVLPGFTCRVADLFAAPQP